MDNDVATALRILDSNSYLTLATADAGGRPWVSPVWFASRGVSEFVWVSKPGARHSQNIGVRPDVALVVFDSTVRPGAADALYVSASAEQVTDDDFERALAIFAEASSRQGLPVWTEADVRDPARHRLYRATGTEAFVLDDKDERRAIGVPDG